MTVWFASVWTLNVVIIWLQVIDYQKNQRIQVFPGKDFLLRRIFFPEDFLWRRFSIEKISISLEKISISFKKISISFEKIFFQEDLSFLLFAKAKLRTSYAGALLTFMNILITFEQISISFKKILISLEKTFQICFLPKQNWGHVMPQPLLSSSCLLLRKIAVL